MYKTIWVLTTIKIYFNDYEKITKKVLFEEINDEKSITALQRIIESKIFEK